MNVLRYEERKERNGTVNVTTFQWITSLCITEKNAEKIADFIRQLYEHFSLDKKGIKRTIKNISSKLPASFGRHLTGEDISKKRLDKPAFN